MQRRASKSHRFVPFGHLCIPTRWGFSGIIVFLQPTAQGVIITLMILLIIMIKIIIIIIIIIIMIIIMITVMLRVINILF